MTQGHFAPTLCYATFQLLIVYTDLVLPGPGLPSEDMVQMLVSTRQADGV